MLLFCTVEIVFVGAVTGEMVGLVAVPAGCMGTAMPGWAGPPSEAGVAWRVEGDSGVLISGSDISLVSDLKRSAARGRGVNFLRRTVPIMSEEVKDLGADSGISIFYMGRLSLALSVVAIEWE